ncbi:MAG: Transcriptional regulator PadR-like family [Candidatus Adlerbacteria bacterium]|nr:Transcriptional regulator PadR-like family [Candidatus Adlerbacteria bacterium]
MKRKSVKTLIIEHLDTQKWKSGLEIADEIVAYCKKHCRRRAIHAVLGFLFTTLDEVLWRPSSGTLYITLHELEEKKEVEGRWRDDPPEVLVKRGGHRKREYRLTEYGRRVRSMRKADQQFFERGVSPQPAAA